MAASGFHEHLEDPSRVRNREALGVPLDSDPEGVGRIFDRFDDPVGCASDVANALPRVIDRLVVRAVDFDRRLPEEDREPGFRRQLDGMNGTLPRVAPLVIQGVGPQRRQILNQGASPEDSHQLRSVADAEHRHPGPVGRLEQSVLEAGSKLSWGIDTRPGALPVPLRGNVERPTAQEQCGAFARARIRERWHHLRLSPGLVQGIEVGTLHGGTPLVVEIRRDADERTHDS